MDPHGHGGSGGLSLEKAGVLGPNPIGVLTVHPPTHPRAHNDLLVTFVLNFQTITVYATVLYVFALYSNEVT